MILYNRFFNVVVLACLCFLLSGCFFTKTGHIKPSPEKKKVVSVELVRPDLLKVGGKVVFAPFKAGSDAEATASLDHFSLVIVKGFADGLKDRTSCLEFMDEEDISKAELLIEGRIELFRRSGLLGRLMNRRALSYRVVGTLKSIQTGDLVARMTAEEKVVFKGTNVDDAAYNAGYGIAAGLIEEGEVP